MEGEFVLLPGNIVIPCIMTSPSQAAEKFREFVEVVQKLRNPDGGCPWDLAQTHESIRPYLIEECYEVLDAIDHGNDSELKKELGDLLLQIVLHSQIAADRGAFSVSEVTELITEKMIRRHPHVFGDVNVKTPEDVKTNWERIKLEEKKDAGEEQAVLSGVPKALPALNQAQRLGEKAAKFNFDWDSIDGVWAKVEEELLELKAEIDLPEGMVGRKERIFHELGDLLFAATQLGRWLGVHSEDALRAGCRRFTERFNKVEKLAEKPLTEHSTEELEALWQQAKKG